MAAWLNDEGYSEGDLRADSRMGDAGTSTDPDLQLSLLPEWVMSMNESQRSGTSKPLQPVLENIATKNWGACPAWAAASGVLGLPAAVFMPPQHQETCSGLLKT